MIVIDNNRVILDDNVSYMYGTTLRPSDEVIPSGIYIRDNRITNLKPSDLGFSPIEKKTDDQKEGDYHESK